MASDGYSWDKCVAPLSLNAIDFMLQLLKEHDPEPWDMTLRQTLIGIFEGAKQTEKHDQLAEDLYRASRRGYAKFKMEFESIRRALAEGEKP